jgi:hypothetical protein
MNEVCNDFQLVPVGLFLFFGTRSSYLARSEIQAFETNSQHELHSNFKLNELFVSWLNVLEPAMISIVLPAILNLLDGNYFKRPEIPVVTLKAVVWLTVIHVVILSVVEF